jgi:hypothetical protein
MVFALESDGTPDYTLSYKGRVVIKQASWGWN